MTAVLINPSFSVNANENYPASNALEGLLSQTDSTGVGITWTADISYGPALVMNVVIDSAEEGYRLSSVNVFVEDVLCG
jgi:hypothetical protein